MKLATKMFLGAAILSVVPVIVTSLLVGGGSVQLARGSLTQAVESQLTSLREVRKQQVGDYVNSSVRSLQAFAASTSAIEGYKNFRQTYPLAASELAKGSDINSMRGNVKIFYDQQFSEEFSRKNPTRPVGLDKWVTELDEAQIALQHAYIVANKNKLGEKNKMVDAIDKSSYATQHAKFHPSFAALQERLGLYDIFLIDTQTDRIVYTVFKEIDFASSLADGIAAKTGLAEVYKKVKASEKADTVALSDYARYLPSYDDHASFVAVPIMDNGKVIGVLAMQLPLDKITSVMTAEKKWADQGLGKTGESYLVGRDLLMRTDSRFLLENKTEFLNESAKTISPTLLAYADKKNTSIGVISVDTNASKQALSGKSGFELINDYRGTPVFSAYGPLDLFGVRLAILAEQDEVEALAGVDSLRLQTIIRTLVISLLILALAGIAAYYFVKTITRPVNALSDMARKVSSGDDNIRSTVTSGDELEDLGGTLNKMLDDRQAVLKQALDENENINNSAINLLQSVYALSEKDLTARAEVSSDIVGTLASSVNQLAAETAQTLTEVQKIAGQVRSAAEATQQQGLLVQSATNRERALLASMGVTLGTATRQMSEVAQLSTASSAAAARTSDATKAAQAAVEGTMRGMDSLREVISETEKRFKRLGERSQEISSAVALVNTISERTHVLSLNASMQAATAGEAGRGFAVVAQEVQRLSDSSRQATGEIAQLVSNIQSETNETLITMNRLIADVVAQTELARSAGQEMTQTQAATGELVGLVQRIAAFSVQQQDMALALQKTVQGMNAGTAETSSAIEQQTDATNTLVQFAQRLNDSVGQFKVA
jgi:methyl-accepting chemotaxis protein